MNENNRMSFALISGIIILGISISIAYISFNILGSSAEASLQNWKLGGAFAGFVFTASLLTSITFQFYKQMTADRTAILQDQIQELQIKLIKGAPRPGGYDIDIDEKHKLVFARPQNWLPKEDMLYRYIEKRPSDKFNANFNVIYQSEKDLSGLYEKLNLGKFDATNIDTEKLYEVITVLSIDILKKSLSLFENDSLLKESIIVDGKKSLKWTLSYTTAFSSDMKNKIKLCQSGVYIYVPKLKALYEFTFSDNEEDYLKSSEVFNNVIRSIRFL